MCILFDHGAPAPLRLFLSGHSITLIKTLGWERLVNGDLLSAVEEAGFDLLLTTDKNLRYQQNLMGRNIAIVVLGLSRWRLVRLVVDQVATVVNAATPGSYTEVEISKLPLGLV